MPNGVAQFATTAKYQPLYPAMQSLHPVLLTLLWLTTSCGCANSVLPKLASTPVADEAFRWDLDLSEGSLRPQHCDDTWAMHWNDLRRLQVETALAGVIAPADIRRVNLCGAELSPQMWNKLQRAPNVEILKLAGTNLQDDDLQRLLEMTHLRELDISATDVTDAGVAQLARLPNLQKVWVDGSQISPSGVESLLRGETIKFISVRNKLVKERDLQSLQETHGDTVEIIIANPDFQGHGGFI